MIDTDESKTIATDELKQALIRCKIGLQDKELKIFLKRLDENRGFITQNEFITRFWSAFTYDDVFGDEQGSESALASIGVPKNKTPAEDETINAMTSHNI